MSPASPAQRLVALLAPDGLTCAFGEPWMGPHPLCEAETERACAAFDRMVAAGVYDAQGYSPNERKAQQRKTARLVRERR